MYTRRASRIEITWSVIFIGAEMTNGMKFRILGGGGRYRACTRGKRSSAGMRSDPMLMASAVHTYHEWVNGAPL